MQLVLPCEDSYLRAAATQRPNYEVGRFDFLPKRVEEELTRLLEKEIHYHRDVEHQKFDLESRYDFSAVAAFQSIDDLNFKYIDYVNLKRFLKTNGFIATERDLTAIIRRLDLNADAKISFTEFAEAIRPVIVSASDLPLPRERPPISPERVRGSRLPPEQLTASSYRERSPARPYLSPNRRQLELERSLREHEEEKYSSPPRRAASPLRRTQGASPDRGYAEQSRAAPSYRTAYESPFRSKDLGVS